MRDKKDIEKIYVVGFPKSGNTWITRLLSDVLSCPAGYNMAEDDIEIASDMNTFFLDENKDPKYKILKNHSLPEFTFSEEISEKRKVVFIRRDFRDVAVSSFFHHNLRYIEEKDVEIKDISVLSLRERMRYYYNRAKFSIYIKKISKSWIGGKRIRSWGNHIEAWEKESKKENCKIAFVRYEDFLKEPKDEILRIINILNLDQPSNKRIDQAIKRQSFKVKKEHLNSLPNDCDIPLGKKFNVRFLRKGVAGDWRRFLSRKNAKVIIKKQGDSLVKHAYVKDNNWHLECKI